MAEYYVCTIAGISLFWCGSCWTIRLRPADFRTRATASQATA